MRDLESEFQCAWPLPAPAAGAPGAAPSTGSSFASRPKLSVSIGQTVTQIPQPMHELVLLSSTSCFSAYCITGMPTWQLREHSPHAMHLSLATILNRESPSFANSQLVYCIIFASGHQKRHQTLPPRNG